MITPKKSNAIRISKMLRLLVFAIFCITSVQSLAIRSMYFGVGDSNAACEGGSPDRAKCGGDDDASDKAVAAGNAPQLLYKFDETSSGTNGAPAAVDSTRTAPAVGLDLYYTQEGQCSTGDSINCVSPKIHSKGGFFQINNMRNQSDLSDNATVDMGYTLIQPEKHLLRSSRPATEINSCKDFTVQFFARPYFPMQGNNNNNNRITPANTTAGNLIIGLSNTAGGFGASPGEFNTSAGGVAAPNWGIYQTGASGDERIGLRIRNQPGNNTTFGAYGSRSSMMESVTNAFSSIRQGDGVMGGLSIYTEYIVSFKAPTTTARGELTLYVNRVPKTYNLTMNPAEANDGPNNNGSPSLFYTNPDFLAGAYLVVGNERFKFNIATTNYDDLNQNWSGEMKHLAIYCKALSKTDVLGDLQAKATDVASVSPDTGRPITEYRKIAHKMANRLTGIIIPIDHPVVLKMEDRIASGDRAGAASLIVNGDTSLGIQPNPNFLNTLVKQFALQMSNREETLKAPLNDFAAAFIGFTRDDRNAKGLLTEDFYYMADPRKVTVRSNLVRDILLSNNHYQDLDNGQWDIGKALISIDGALGSDTSPAGEATKAALLPYGVQHMGQVVILGDPANQETQPVAAAGVLTSRAFLSSHAVAGTNRRMVEYSLREFTCMPIAEVADISASGARVGRDVDRAPGLDNSKFETNCKGCHSVMDGFRGAFANWDFSTVTVGGRTFNYVRNASIKTGMGAFAIVPTCNNNTSPGCRVQEDRSIANSVVFKMNHNFSFFPTGYELTDDSYVNNATGFKNKALFGWRGPNARGGFGITDFGHTISDSVRFSQCMAKRVYESVCLPPTGYDFNFVKDLIFKHASQFESDNYKLKGLFQRVAADPQCIK